MTLQDMFDTNGYRVDEIMGEKRYVTSDEHGRSVVGPVRHRRRARTTAYRHPQTDADATIVLPSGEEVGVGVAPVQVRDEPEGRRARWMRRLKDREWHRAVRHTAVDVAMWASCLSLAAVIVKLAVVVVTL